MPEPTLSTDLNPSQQQGEFAVQRIYLKDTSFESPLAPAIFAQNWKPEINLQINSSFKTVAEFTYEVVLSVTVTAKLEQKTAFLAEAQQAGLFHVNGFAEKEHEHIIGSFCPNILFPFAREAIADMVSKGGFPQLLLAPINFDALFAQHTAQREKAKLNAEPIKPVH